MRLFSCPCCEAAAPGAALRGRRAVLGAGLALLPFADALAQAQAQAQPQARGGAARRLAIRRVQTGEAFSGTYWRDGRYDREALRRLDWVMRDPGMEEATPMDPRLFDVLHAVQTRLGSAEQWEVISGYRAPETNAARARESRRVSRVSLHMSGMAADCRLPDRDSLGLARTAVDMETGGVGLYRRDGFVHLDCGPVRRW